MLHDLTLSTTPVREYLADFVPGNSWCAWRTEIRNSKPTKVPYQGIGKRAKANDPSTWITAEEAGILADQTDFITDGSIGGIGLFLGIDCGEGWRLAGVDLDSCINASGIIAPWAIEILDRFNSYSEVSPSATGIKIFFCYKESDLSQLREIIGQQWSRNFKEKTQAEHAPGFELHLGNRYFAVTAKHHENYPDTFSPATVDDIRWLINEMGGRFARATDNPGKTTAAITPSSPGGTDQSRSGRAYNRLMNLWWEGEVKNEVEAKAALLANYPKDPGIAEWMVEKGLRDNEREFRRLWDKVSSKEQRRAPILNPHYRHDDGSTGFEDIPLPESSNHRTAYDDDGDFEDLGEGNAGTEPKSERQSKLRWAHEYNNLPVITYWDDAQQFPRNPEGTTMMVVADFGCHKTNLVLLFCVEAALDKGARVCYILCEGAYGLLKKRVPEHCEARGIPVEALENRIGFVPDGISLKDEKGLNQLIVELQVFNPEIIVIDTLGQAANGVDLNSSHMGDLLGTNGPVGKLKRAFKALIIIPCHYGKDKNRGILGHTSIGANTENILELDFNKQTRTVTATLTRQKDGPEGRQSYYAVPETGTVLKRLVSIPSEDEQQIEADDTKVRVSKISYILTTQGAFDFETGLSDRQLAEMLHPRPLFISDAAEAEWKTRINDETEKLSNNHRSKTYRHICEKRVPIGGGDKSVWRWFFRGDPTTVERK